MSKDNTPPPTGEPVVESNIHDTAELEALARIEDDAPTGAGSAAAPESQVDTAELLAMPICVTFALLAPNWNISQAEATQMAQAWAPVLDKWVPGGLGAFGPEIAAALVTLGILAPRMLSGKPPKLPPKEPAAEPSPNARRPGVA